MGQMPWLSLSQAKSIKALKERADPKQWPGLITSSSITGFLMEGALFHLCWLSDTSTLPCVSFINLL